MAALTLVQEEDESKTLTASVAPTFGATVVWVMLDRVTKEAVITKNIADAKITGTSIVVDVAAEDTEDCNGAYYYELWQHRVLADKLLDSGTVQITPTYAGDVS